jgi:hypothetical protein
MPNPFERKMNMKGESEDDEILDNALPKDQELNIVEPPEGSDDALGPIPE